jgi:hypothetical protein
MAPPAKRAKTGKSPSKKPPSKILLAPARSSDRSSSPIRRPIEQYETVRVLADDEQLVVRGDNDLMSQVVGKYKPDTLPKYKLAVGESARSKCIILREILLLVGISFDGSIVFESKDQRAAFSKKHPSQWVNGGKVWHTNPARKQVSRLCLFVCLLMSCLPVSPHVMCVVCEDAERQAR